MSADATGGNGTVDGPETDAADSVRPTRRWRGVVAVSLAALAIGLVADRPGILLLAVVGVVFAAYPRVLGPPSVDVEIDRQLSDRNPERGEDVDVTVTVRNAGRRPLFDVRVVDGVPPVLAVVGGTPRAGTTLRGGGEHTFSYTVRVKRGKHAFEPATIVARDVAGGHEVETTAGTESDIDCTADVEQAPLRQQTVDTVGRVVASQVGSGIEFDRTREYQPGDAISRIDWNRYARTGDLSTVEYRKERAATVVLLVDARRAAYHGVPGESHAVADSVSGAKQLLAALAGGRNQIGVAAFGRDFAWLAPGAGREHTERAHRLLATHRTLASTPPGPEEESDHDDQVRLLRTRLPPDAQVVLFTPLCDDAIVDTVRRLEVRGYATSVVSPDATAVETGGQRLAGVERRNRLRELRQSEIPVVEWAPSKPLAAAISDAPGRWPA